MGGHRGRGQQRHQFFAPGEGGRGARAGGVQLHPRAPQRLPGGRARGRFLAGSAQRGRPGVRRQRLGQHGRGVGRGDAVARLSPVGSDHPSPPGGRLFPPRGRGAVGESRPWGGAPRMMRYVCVHGHFYQPPRENPWLEAIELQDSAYPYHDWNDRITAECYAPNAASRILDGDGRIVQIVNNYARISFDVGPTLLAWLEAKKPAVYQLILQADRESQERFSGHGSAMAQAYNHMIMPLASERDRDRKSTRL